MYLKFPKTKTKKQYYVVKKGFHPGVYFNWPDCQKEVQGFPGAVYKGFVSKEDAETWYGKPIGKAPEQAEIHKAPARDIKESEISYPAHVTVRKEGTLPAALTIYTDGSCLVNPNGPGGFAAVFLDREGQELFYVTGGEPDTTNNRMELRAAYEALKQAGTRKTIDFHTDSKYLQRAFMNHWVDHWQRNGWKTASGQPVANQDLWRALIGLMARYRVTFSWVKGHAGTRYNELCDQLAKREAMKFRK